jgi:hypothetical protein
MRKSVRQNLKNEKGVKRVSLRVIVLKRSRIVKR